MVNLIPEKFIVDHVSVTGWGDLLDGEALAMDFTNKFQEQFSMHSYTDSTENGGGWDYTDYVDSVAYNDSYQFIERVSPSMSIVQLEASGTGQKWFGDDKYSTVDGDGDEIEIPVVDTTKTGREMSLLGYPLFRQGTENYRHK